MLDGFTTQKMKFSIKDFFSKCDQIRRKLRIWSHLLKKSLMKNFIFCVVIEQLHDLLKTEKFRSVFSSLLLLHVLSASVVMNKLGQVLLENIWFYYCFTDSISGEMCVRLSDALSISCFSVKNVLF